MAGYQLSHADLEALWVLAGGPQAYADTAAAIAEAESGGCQYALAGPRDIRPVKVCSWTVTSRENSCGFWQINLDAHPGYSAPSIFGQLTNASAAVAISSNGRNFGPWTTYTNGAYKQFLHSAGTAGPQPGAIDFTAGTNDATRALVGYAHLQHVQSRVLPKALRQAQQIDRATLRALNKSRKVR